MNSIATHINQSQQSDLPGAMSLADQRTAFGKARRHTYMVKFLRFALPLASLAIIGLYFLPGKIGTNLSKIPVSIENIDLSSQGLKMINPHYSGGNKKMGKYSVEADYALQQITTPHILELHKIRGEIEQKDNKWTKLTASKGIYNTSSEHMKLEGEILITTNQGMQAKLQGAVIDMKKQLITSNSPVDVKMNENTITAAGMTISTAKKSVLFKGNVKVKLFKNKSMSKTGGK